MQHAQRETCPWRTSKCGRISDHARLLIVLLYGSKDIDNYKENIILEEVVEAKSLSKVADPSIPGWET
jgi:hypothetical protein